MNWKPTGIALLTAMVLVAGCLGGNPGTGTTTHTDANRVTTTGVATTTPATTTTTTISPANADLPPGVTTDGISNVSALVSAHESALTKSGFRFKARSSTRRNGKTTAGVVRGNATAGLSTMLSTLDVTANSDYHSTTWSNESTTIVRATSGTKTQYRVYQRRSYDIAQSNTISEMLRSGEFSIRRIERVDGQTRTRLHADRYSGEGRFENVSAYDATLVVDSTGRVHEFHWHIVTDEQTRTVDFHLTATQLDGLERPDWVDKAGQAITAKIRTSTESGRLVISHRGGNALPAGSKLKLSHDGTTYTATFDHSLETGETAYFYFPEDGGDPVLTTTDPGTDAGIQFDGSYSLTIVSSDGIVVSSSSFAIGHASSSAP